MSVSANMSQCARCGEPCDAFDLVCNRCSETRVRAALPASDAPPEDQSDATLAERLSQLEQLAGEKAYRLVMSVDGTLGGEATVILSVLTAPDGPATPPEDVWAEPAVVATFECGTAAVVATRLQTAMRLTAERKLHPPEVRRRLRVGTRGFMGEPAAAGMLLDARLHMARLALEPRRVHGTRIEEAGGTVHVVVEFAEDDQITQVTQITIVELFSEASPGAPLRESVGAWVSALEQKLDPARDF